MDSAAPAMQICARLIGDERVEVGKHPVPVKNLRLEGCPLGKRPPVVGGREIHGPVIGIEERFHALGQRGAIDFPAPCEILWRKHLGLQCVELAHLALMRRKLGRGDFAQVVPYVDAETDDIPVDSSRAVDGGVRETFVDNGIAGYLEIVHPLRQDDGGVDAVVLRAAGLDRNVAPFGTRTVGIEGELVGLVGRETHPPVSP